MATKPAEYVRCLFCEKRIPKTQAKKAGSLGGRWQCRNEEACVTRLSLHDMAECVENGDDW